MAGPACRGSGPATEPAVPEGGAQGAETTESAVLVGESSDDRSIPSGCENADACAEAAEAALERGDHAGAIERLQYGCAHQSVAACALLGNLIVQGLTGTPNPERGLVLLDRACEGGHAAACRDAAGVANDQLHDALRAAEYLQAGCDLREATSCGVLAIFYNEGVGVARDVDKALKLMRQACELGRSDACGAAEDLAAALARER